MKDNNLESENIEDINHEVKNNEDIYEKHDYQEEKNDEIKASSLLLRDLAVDFEEQLYLVKKDFKINIIKLQEKEQEVKDIEQTKDHHLEMFSPMYKKAFSTKEIEEEIEKIKIHINELEQEQQMLLCKISGLKTASRYLDSFSENEENSELGKTTEHIQRIKEKGLGILEAQEVERQRIARDLHDTTVQNLTSLVHKSELCVKLIDIDTIRAKLELNVMSNTLKMIINDMRGIIYNLKPMTLDDLGLTITIQRYANKITNLNNIHVKVTANDEPNDILPVFKLTIFRIIQEACNNIIKHANATFIYLDLNYEENRINLAIKDNGIGFDINKFNSSDKVSSFGLSIMKERISLLSGSLEIKSEYGKGTLITVTIPISINEGGDK